MMDHIDANCFSTVTPNTLRHQPDYRQLWMKVTQKNNLANSLNIETN